jgi:adenylyltransferase/sulfurtransferase
MRESGPPDPPDLGRYARQVLLPEVGSAGQRKLREGRVLCVGAGGLGSPVALYLAAAGVGRLGIVDFDAVDLSNLQRQVLHGTPDIGRPKTQSAVDALQRLNPDVEVVPHETRLTSENAKGILAGYDVVVDGTDNFPTRYLVNDACVMLGKPNVYGSIFRWEGQASLFAPHWDGPCYRCLFPEPPPAGTVPSCAEAGVLGVLPGVIGCLQATEVLKLLLGQGRSLLGRLVVFDALSLQFRELRLRRDHGCPVCGDHPTITELRTETLVCDPRDRSPDEVAVADLQRALEQPELGITVVDVREAEEWRSGHLAGARHLPLSAIAERAAELDPRGVYYVHCQVGVRSLRAVAWLKAHGFGEVKSVQGGLTAWTSTFATPLVEGDGV